VSGDREQREREDRQDPILMGKEHAGRDRPPPLPPYGEGARGALPASAAAALWGGSAQDSADLRGWVGNGGGVGGDRSGGKGRGGGAAGVGHGEIDDGISRNQSGRRSPIGLASSLSTTRPLRARRHVMGRWPSVWAMGFFWCGAKLTQVCVIFVMFLTSISNLLDL
jgi:hypothetical protein